MKLFLISEWTATLTKFLKDQLLKLQDLYQLNQQGGAINGSLNGCTNLSTPTNPTTIPVPPSGAASNGNLGAKPLSPNVNNQLTSSVNSEHKLALDQWNYCTLLAKYMFEEGLLDRQDMLQWILELLDRLRTAPADDGILKLLLPLAMQYLEEFVQSELLSRKLSYLCCRKLDSMCTNVDVSLNPEASQAGIFDEYLTCAHHRGVVLSLSAIIQVNKN